MVSSIPLSYRHVTSPAHRARHPPKEQLPLASAFFDSILTLLLHAAASARRFETGRVQIIRREGRHAGKPSSSSNFSIRALRARLFELEFVLAQTSPFEFFELMPEESRHG